MSEREVVLRDDDLLVSRTDRRGVIESANDHFVRISGFSREELIGRPHNLVRHPDMPKAAFADLWATISAGHPWVGVVKNRTKDGGFYWVRAAVTPLIEGGVVVGHVSVRVKPSAAEVETATRAYGRINQGQGGWCVDRGQLSRSGVVGAMQRWAASFEVGMAITLVSVGGLGVWAGHQLGAHPWCAGGTLAMMVVLALVAVGVLGRRLRQRLTAATGVLDALSANDYSTRIPLGRPDICAPLMLALARVQTRIGYMVLNEREQRVLAEQEQLRRRERVLHELEGSVSRSLAELGTEIGRLRDTAKSQATAAEDVADSARTVASSVAELNDAIRGISDQTVAVSELMGVLTGQAADSREAMARLSTTAHEIMGVAKLIRSIADQTNLLALNATIEAARAGTAGKGFAVVAGEVKSLAVQTSGSTAEIDRMIAAIQQVSQLAATSNEAVINALHQVDTLVRDIAGAVAHQTAVVEAVAHTAERSSSASAETGKAAASVAIAADALAHTNADLTGAVAAFKQSHV